MIWMIASVATLIALVPAGWLAMTAEAEQRLVALEMAGILCTLEMMLLTMAFHRMPMMDLAVALALLSFGSGMVFAHFLARYL